MTIKQPSITARIGALFRGSNSDLGKLRRQIAKLKDERAIIIESRLPKEEALARLLQFVDAEADSFDGYGRFINAASTHDADPGSIEGFELWQGARAPDAGPILCWLLRDTIKEKLAETIRASDYPEGIPSNQRAVAIADIERQLFQLEREEEALICEAEEAGIEIERREDCDPRIVLEVMGL